MSRGGRLGSYKIRELDLLSHVSLPRSFVFLQRPATLGNFGTNATLAIKIPTILSCPTNSKFTKRQFLRTNRAMLRLRHRHQLFSHLDTPLHQTLARFV